MATRALAGVYFVLMLVFVTWPGLVPFARVEPLILGLPFSMAWMAAWIAGSVLVLTVVDRVERRYREVGDPRATPGVGPERSGDEGRPGTRREDPGRGGHRSRGGASDHGSGADDGARGP
jgi:hypothetical protein